MYIWTSSSAHMRILACVDKIGKREKHLPILQARLQPHLGALSGGRNKKCSLRNTKEHATRTNSSLEASQES